MKVFISWSGRRSKAVAEALHDWLKEVVQSVNPWISSEDIRKGKRWSIELAQQLESTQVGVICLTPENLTAPWLLFEAGALSKLLKDAYVFTYLIGVEPTAVTGPLAEFQHTQATKDETHQMVKTINAVVDEQRRLSATLLDRAFNGCWPELEQQLNTLPDPQEATPPPRKAEDMLQEVLEIIRGLAKPPPVLMFGPGAAFGTPTGLSGFSKPSMSSARVKALKFLLRSAGVDLDERSMDVILDVLRDVMAEEKAPKVNEIASKPETLNTSKPVPPQKKERPRRRR